MNPKNPWRIVFLDAGTVDLGDLDMRRLRRQGIYSALDLNSQDPLPRAAGDTEVLISNKFPLRESELAKLPKLRLICVAATGTNNVELAAAEQRGIAVCNVAGYSTPTVAEHTLLLLLVLGHRLPEHARSVQDGTWSRGPHFALLDFPYRDLAGKRLGIVGFGAIGRRVACLAESLGMRVSVARLPGRKYTSRKKRVALKALLQGSDFVSLHCPLTEQTRGLIDAVKLGWMKPSAVLLNLARGPIVDEAAVAAALRSGRLAAYAGDVLAQEPPPENHPLLAPELRDKVLLTPHVAWASRESRQRLVDEIAANIAAFRRGRRRNRVA